MLRYIFRYVYIRLFLSAQGQLELRLNKHNPVYAFTLVTASYVRNCFQDHMTTHHKL